MLATEKEFFSMLDQVFEFTRISNLNQTLPRRFQNGETLFISEIFCLHLIGEEPNMTVTEIASRIHRTMSAASQLVTRLEKKGIVTKNPNYKDKKVMYLELTEKGVDMLNEHTLDDQIYYADIFSQLNDFTSEDIGKICRLIKVLSNVTLNAIEEKKSPKNL